MSIIIKEITSRKELKKFIEFPHRLYRNNNYYVPQLNATELSTLSKDRNSAFEYCQAKYWLAYDDKGIITGRIAGILNPKYNQKMGKIYVRFGWIDFIDDQQVVAALLDTVEKWANQIKADAVHGPLGFTDFDISGVLTDGFNELPTAYGKYNFPYYAQLIEKCGYNKEVDWVEYNVQIPDSMPERFPKMAQFIAQRYNLRCLTYPEKKQLLKNSDDLFSLLNKEYEKIHGFSSLTPRQIEELKKQFIPLLRLKFVSVVVNAQNNVVGFGVCVPSMSKALQKAKGRLLPFGFLHILKAMYRNDTLDSVLIAISSDYKDKGVNSLIFHEIGMAVLQSGITNIETTRELEDNHNVLNLWNKLQYREHKRARCYIKEL
jgi:hypothetical protein